MAGHLDDDTGFCDVKAGVEAGNSYFSGVCIVVVFG